MNFVEAQLVETGARTRVSLGESELVLGPLAADADARVGDRVLMGMRPEHLGWRRPEEGASGILKARVELIEHIEPESYVSATPLDPAVVIRSADEFIGDNGDDSAHLTSDDARFMMLRVPTDEVPDRGAVIDLVADTDRVSLFDIATGNSLSEATRSLTLGADPSGWGRGLERYAASASRASRSRPMASPSWIA